MYRYKDDIDQPTFERIERYLLGRMEERERLAFKQEMAAHADLRLEVELQRKLLAYVEVGSSVEAGRSGLLKAMPASSPGNKKKWSSWLYAAAAVLALAVMITWWYRDRPANADQLFANYFQPDPGLPVAMSSTSEYQFNDAMVSYKEGDYERAITLWKQLVAEQGGTDTLHYFIGMASLGNHQSAEAITHLSYPAGDESSEWRHKAIWYLALAYLQSGDTRSAADQLKLLPSENRAVRLLEEIGKISSKE